MIKIRLSTILGKKRMTQSQLCELTGIRPGTINAYYHEYAKRLNVDDLDKLCNVLGCSLEELLEHIPDKDQKKKTE